MITFATEFFSRIIGKMRDSLIVILLSLQKCWKEIKKKCQKREYESLRGVQGLDCRKKISIDLYEETSVVVCGCGSIQWSSCSMIYTRIIFNGKRTSKKHTENS